MALELVCGADFWCNRHCRTSPVVLEEFWGQVWPKIGRKPRSGTDISPRFRVLERARVHHRSVSLSIWVPGGSLAGATNPAVLKAKVKTSNFEDSGRNLPKTYDSLRKMAIRTLPRDPPGQGTKLKIMLSTGMNSEFRVATKWP